MSEHPINGLMETAMEKIREMVDVNTIVGSPIASPDGTVIIPVSKVSFGFASGGSDLPAKVQKDLFGGGSGAGISIQPVAFIVISNGEAKLLQMSMNASSSNAIINMVPEVVDKITSLVSSKKDKAKSSEDVSLEK